MPKFFRSCVYAHVLIVLSFMTGPVFAKSETTVLEVALFDGCPFICPDESGPFVDGLKTAFAGSQYELLFKRMPFARAIKQLQSGHIDLLPGVLKDGIDGAIFPESWLYFTRMCFYSRTGDTWQWNGLDSLDNRLLAVEEGIIHTQAFQDHISDRKSVTFLTGDDILPRQIRMLELGRIQSFTAEQSVLAYYMKQNDIPPDSFENSGCFSPEYEYVAIFAQHPNAQDIKAVLNSGLVEYGKTIAADLQ